jgi:hypothetical protein
MYTARTFAKIILHNTVLLIDTKKFIPVNFDGPYYASSDYKNEMMCHHKSVLLFTVVAPLSCNYCEKIKCTVSMRCAIILTKAVLKYVYSMEYFSTVIPMGNRLLKKAL